MDNSRLRNTRRWPRHQVDLPIRIATCNLNTRLVVPGLATEISRGGMSLYGGVPLQPGDLMEVEFRTSTRIRITGVVRNRSGYCFGLEFFDVLPNERPVAGLQSGTAASSHAALTKAWPVQAESVASNGYDDGARGQDELETHLWRKHEAYLRHTELTIDRLCQEVMRIRKMRRKLEALGPNSPAGH